MADTEQLLAEIRDTLKAQAVPIGHRLWDADDVAAYLRVQRRYVLERLATRPDWPKAIRLTDGVHAPARWHAVDVIEWARRRRAA